MGISLILVCSTRIRADSPDSEDGGERIEEGWLWFMCAVIQLHVGGTNGNAAFSSRETFFWTIRVGHFNL